MQLDDDTVTVRELIVIASGAEVDTATALVGGRPVDLDSPVASSALRPGAAIFAARRGPASVEPAGWAVHVVAGIDAGRTVPFPRRSTPTAVGSSCASAARRLPTSACPAPRCPSITAPSPWRPASSRWPTPARATVRSCAGGASAPTRRPSTSVSRCGAVRSGRADGAGRAAARPRACRRRAAGRRPERAGTLLPLPRQPGQPSRRPDRRARPAAQAPHRRPRADHDPAAADPGVRHDFASPDNGSTPCSR